MTVYLASRKVDRTSKRPMLRRLKTIRNAAVVLCALMGVSAHAADSDFEPRTMYGDLGILEMPTARMAPDGQISLTLAGRPDTQRYSLGFQVLPWLEGSFRYSHIKQFRGITDYYDRSFGLKLRLSREDEFWPELSLGIRDILGTGVYGEEYLVATKHLYDFEVTAGIGWGRLASNSTLPNPLGEIFPSFKTRASVFSNGTGKLDFGQFFHGPDVGVFGGIIWKTPIEGLDILAEYSSDDYSLEQTATQGFRTKIPVNVGLAYHLFDSVTVSAGYYYGTTYGLVLSLFTDPTQPIYPAHIGPDVPAPKIRSDTQQLQALENLVYGHLPRNISVRTSSVDSAELIRSDISDGSLGRKLGARDVESMGNVLFVDARFETSVADQCKRYSRVAASLGEKADTIAMSDFKSSSGKVKFCPISHSEAREADFVDDPLPSIASDGTDQEAPFLANPNQDEGKALIERAIEHQNIDVEAISIKSSKISVYYRNKQYWSEDEAAGRIVRVLMDKAPPNIEIFDLVSIVNGVPMRTFRIVRSALERTVITDGDATELANAVGVDLPALSLPDWHAGRQEAYPRFSWGLSPTLEESLFDPARPLAFRVSADVSAGLEITPGLIFEGGFDANIWNNFELNAPSASSLPHVRSDASKYYKYGEYGFSSLDASYRARIARDVFVEVKAGYLEDMFAGAGGQILWRPENSRFTVGADLYQVWQRDFNRLFGLQRYHILTGHVSVYYQSPWHGLNFQIHAGRYLAGDDGVTFEVTREFQTGVEIGFFATFTNVPFNKFGEGSFDKGLIIRMPFEWALPFFTQSGYNLDLRSLTRDGGQRLDDDDSLYGETRSTSYGEIWSHLDDITAP